MRPALNGLQDGLLSRGGLPMPTRAWTLTLISPATRRKKSPFPLTARENHPLRLRPAPLLRLLLLVPCLTSEPPCTIFFVCFFFFFFLSFFTLGSEPRIYVMPFWALKLNEYPIFYLLVFSSNCVPYAALPKLTRISGYMAFSEKLSS